MKAIVIITLFSLTSVLCFSQTDYDKQVEFFASDIAKKLPSEKKKIAVIDFKNNDNDITQLTRLVAEDISSELAIISNGQAKFEVVERNNLKSILNNLKLSSNRDESKIAKELGKKALADFLITGIVTLFGDNYRISLKVLDTENGNIITASKGMVVKTSALEDLHNKIIEKDNTIQNRNETINNTSPKILESAIKSQIVSPTGWIDFENKEASTLYVYVSSDQSVQLLTAKNFEELSLSANSKDKMPSLKPGTYYICAVLSKWDSQCLISKKVEIIGGSGSTVILKY